MGDYYEHLMKNTIAQAEEERREIDNLEEFYRGLARMRDALGERIMCAADELPREVAEEILG